MLGVAVLEALAAIVALREENISRRQLWRCWGGVNLVLESSHCRGLNIRSRIPLSWTS